MASPIRTLRPSSQRCGTCGAIYEVRADGDRQTYRILFASEGRRGQVLLALDGFSKTTQKTPPEKIRLAERRLADWRRRGKAQSQL
jgi:phage-related protein